MQMMFPRRLGRSFFEQVCVTEPPVLLLIPAVSDADTTSTESPNVADTEIVVPQLLLREIELAAPQATQP